MLSMEGIAKQAMMALMFSRGLVFRHTRLWCTWKTSETTAHHHHDMLAVCLRPCDPPKAYFLLQHAFSGCYLALSGESWFLSMRVIEGSVTESSQQVIKDPTEEVRAKEKSTLRWPSLLSASCPDLWTGVQRSRISIKCHGAQKTGCGIE